MSDDVLGAVERFMNDSGLPTEIKGESDNPRYELFAAGISICSQKVRTVLFEKDQSFISHEMNPQPGTPPRNWLPSYVKMRALGAKGLKLAGGFTGRSSVETEGIDLCAVPTLIDRGVPRVVVDSAKIVNYIDDQHKDISDLRPADIVADIDAQVAIVDQTPHVAMLYGGHPTLDKRPAAFRKRIGPPLDMKLKLLGEMMESVKDDPFMVEVYTAKISKEKVAYDNLENHTNHEAVYQEVEDLLNKLEDDLKDRKPGQWLFGDRYTMADIMWGINLHRLQNVGVLHYFGERTKAYAADLYKRDSLKKGLISWPNTWFWAPEYFDQDMLDQFVGNRPDAA